MFLNIELLLDLEEMSSLYFSAFVNIFTDSIHYSDKVFY